MGNIFGIAFCSFIGENIIMAMIRRFDPVLTVMVTNVRKALTITLSFFFFPKHFTYLYPLGGSVLFLGILTGVYRKNREKADKFLRRTFGRFGSGLPKRTKT